MAIIGYWKFDEGTGTTANDSSGGGFTGTLTGTAYFFNGKMDNVLIYNRALSAADVATLYADPLCIYRASDNRWLKVAAPTGDFWQFTWLYWQ